MKKSQMANINWEKAYLYHGTSSSRWKDSIISNKKDVRIKIPQHEQNWLGRGLYFGVNNIITPIKFALMKEKAQKTDPIIIEIPASEIKDDIKNRILDLTHHVGLLGSFIISEEFKGLAKDFNDTENLTTINKGLFKSKMYSDIVKTFFSLDQDWYKLMKDIEPVIRELKTENTIIHELKKSSTMNISNLIYDWFNYYVSGGNENEVPIRAIVANFNTGSPLLLKGYNKSSISERTFYDFTTILSRTEISFLGYDYYKRKDEWNLSSIFNDGFIDKLETYEGEGQIINLISNIIYENIPWVNDKNDSDTYARELYNEIERERDKL